MRSGIVVPLEAVGKPMATLSISAGSMMAALACLQPSQGLRSLAPSVAASPPRCSCQELMLDLFLIEIGQILKVLVEQTLAGKPPKPLESFLSAWLAPSWRL